MPITIQISFNDDAGQWHDFAVIPEDSFDLTRMDDHVEYRIRTSPHDVHELGDLIDMTGTRLWKFDWLKAGKDGGLSVRRTMRFDRVLDGVLTLSTADAVGRLD